MTFSVNGKKVLLQGNPSLGKSLISFRSLIKYFEQGGTGLLLELHGLAAEPCSQPSSEIEAILNSFQGLFTMSQELPPPRALDRQIVLTHDTSPVSVRPYQYPHIQKDEIEKLVEEMQAASIIQPSSNLFSSPVILVKKKNGS